MRSYILRLNHRVGTVEACYLDAEEYSKAKRENGRELLDYVDTEKMVEGRDGEHGYTMMEIIAGLVTAIVVIGLNQSMNSIDIQSITNDLINLRISVAQAFQSELDYSTLTLDIKGENHDETAGYRARALEHLTLEKR